MAKFIKSADLVGQYFSDHRPQFCFVGRSNVGKSSLINGLANAKIAKVSSTPGHTKLVNFFDFNRFVLVDLPGYGYAMNSKSQNETIQAMIEEYLQYGSHLKGVFQLCNIDVITTDDQHIAQALQKLSNTHNIAHYIVLTKADKVNKSHFDNNKHKIASYLNVNPENMIPVSTKTNLNLKQLLNIINNLI